MSDNEALMQQAEGAAAWRRFMLVINTITYVAWVAVFGIRVSGANIPLPVWANIAAVACAVVWGLSMIGILWDVRRLKRNRAMAGLLDDERTVALRGRAFQTGYWVLVAALAILYGLAGFVPLETRLVLPALIALAVAVPNLTYAWLYRN